MGILSFFDGYTSRLWLTSAHIKGDLSPQLCEPIPAKVGMCSYRLLRIAIIMNWFY